MRSMRKSLIVVAVVFGLVLGSAGSTSAITNGQPDGDEHPYVGLVVFDVYVPDVGNVPAWRCSGALLSPTVLLTAGHCTDGAGAARVWFDEVVEGNLDYPWGGPSAVEAAEIHTHPDFCIGCGPGLPGFDTHDVGMVVLAEPVPEEVVSEYAELAEEGLVDTLAPMTDVTIVGYGVQSRHRGGGPPFWEGPMVRLFAPTKLVTNEQVHGDEYIILTANPARGKGGTCFGDSGGPDLLAGTNTVLAVNSYVTSDECAGVTYSNRIEISEVLKWIDEFLH